MPAPSGSATTFVGIVLIVLGLGALAETAWFWHTHAAMEEPASPGRTPNPSGSTFHRLLDAKTDEEREHWKRVEEAEWREAIEQGRRDALWGRIRLYGAVPGGLLVVLAGSWLITSRQREHAN